MEWNTGRITELTWKYLKDELSPVEREELDAWLSDPYNRARFDERTKTDNILEGVMMWELAKEVQVGEWSRGEEAGSAKVVAMGEPPVKGKRRGRWIAAAAMVAVLAGAAVWWQGFDKRQNDVSTRVAVTANVLQPGGNKAVLILADGKTVDLDEARKGTVARQGDAEAIKGDSGLVAYHNNNNGDAAGVENAIVTPRGGGYLLILADGTKVWLNAASKITFPTVFTGRERLVTLEGEAYIEVAADARHPFIVSTTNMKVRVLGTSFDLMAYKDEGSVRTSLSSGAVEVIADAEKALLKPGQQAQMQEGKLKVEHCNIDQVLSWKNGYLDFRGADIETVMRAVRRWWNVDVQFSGAVNPERFTGQLNKSLTGQEALQILTASGYHFKIEGKTIIVLP